MDHRLDAPTVRWWCRLAVDDLAAARDRLDALNVFPVPDFDTGTNLHATMLAAHRAVDACPADTPAGELWRALAHGALLGARGNSGVILSQYLRGLADVLGPACEPPARDSAPAGHRAAAPLPAALSRAATLARAVVAEPVEGTVLTVATAVARHAAIRAPGGQQPPGHAGHVLAAAAADAQAALARTPDQLPVLRECGGIVDAGAAGLCLLLGALARACEPVALVGGRL